MLALAAHNRRRPLHRALRNYPSARRKTCERKGGQTAKERGKTRRKVVGDRHKKNKTRKGNERKNTQMEKKKSATLEVEMSAATKKSRSKAKAVLAKGYKLAPQIGLDPRPRFT